jgi:hypothetical protein
MSLAVSHEVAKILIGIETPISLYKNIIEQSSFKPHFIPKRHTIACTALDVCHFLCVSRRAPQPPPLVLTLIKEASVVVHHLRR